MIGNYRFWRDPVFLACGLGYVVNRWLLKFAFASDFLHYWFSDLLLAPCALPVVFWIFGRLHLREGEAPPSWWEICWILAVWSVLFEVIGPRVFSHATGDWRDVVMYWLGAFAAWCLWHSKSLRAASLRA